MTSQAYEHLWKDPKNWGGGLTGFYFCKEDPRLWVPKRIPALGITVNLGHPKGGAMLVGIFMVPFVILLIGTVVASLAAAACH